MNRIFAALAAAFMLAAVPAHAQGTAVSKGYVDLGTQVETPATDCGPAGLTCQDNAATLGEVEIWIGYQFGVVVQNWQDVSYLFTKDATDWTDAHDAVALIKQMHASSPISQVKVRNCWHRMQWTATYDYETFSDKANEILSAQVLRSCFPFNT